MNKNKNLNNNKKKSRTACPMINAILNIIEKIEKPNNINIKYIPPEKKISFSKYDYIINFSSFFKFINDKKCLIQNFCENKDIKLDINIYNCLCIKGNNFKLQTKFLNELNKYNLLMINYEENDNIYILNNDDKELLTQNNSINEILENKKISLNFLNSFLAYFSEVYIIFLDEENERNNEKLIEETIKKENMEKYIIIHSYLKKNKDKIKKKFENKNYRKVAIINERYERIGKDIQMSYYYIENNKEIIHFIYIEDNPNENKEIFDIINEKISTKTIIRPKDFNFKNEYLIFFKNYLSQIFNNIEINYNDDNNKNIEIKLISEPIKKEIISSELIFPPKKPQLKYSFFTDEDIGKINFYIETDTKAIQFSGNISTCDNFNIIRLTIKYDDKDRNNNAIFSNKDAEMKENEEIKVDHNIAIIYDGYLNKNNNKIKYVNGILSFESEITTNLNKTLRSFNFNFD